jgi:hypothetical protein
MIRHEALILLLCLLESFIPYIVVVGEIIDLIMTDPS